MPNPTDGEVDTQDVKQPAEASAAETEGVKASSMLEAMQAAMRETEEPPASTEQDHEAQATASAEGDKPETAAEDDGTADLEGLAPRAQQRIQQLVGARKKADAERDAAITERDAFKDRATRLDRITGYMAENQLTAQDVDTGFRLMALVRNDPERALQELLPVVEKLQQATGRDIPDDLRERVRLGFIRERDALELSEARARNRLLSERSTETAERTERQEAERRVNDQMSAIVRHVDDWNSEQATRDPDFNSKQTRIGELVELELRRSSGLPDPAKVRGMLDGIKRRVDTEFRSFRPKPASVVPVEGSASPSSRPEPKTMLEAMKQAI